MKQTAVKFLIDEISCRFIISEELRIAMYKAIEMEKEQIRIAYMEGAFEKMRHLEGKEFMMPTEYYNETFKPE
jgi:hypothetical protein